MSQVDTPLPPAPLRTESPVPATAYQTERLVSAISGDTIVARLHEVPGCTAKLTIGKLSETTLDTKSLQQLASITSVLCQNPTLMSVLGQCSTEEIDTLDGMLSEAGHSTRHQVTTTS